jgi:hypothetical protein
MKLSTRHWDDIQKLRVCCRSDYTVEQKDPYAILAAKGEWATRAAGEFGTSSVMVIDDDQAVLNAAERDVRARFGRLHRGR